MSIKCCFAGHKDVYYSDHIKNKLRARCEELITKNYVTEFLLGNYGRFDKIAASVLQQLKTVYPHIVITLVIPYLTSEINEFKEQYYNKYDNIVMAGIPASTPHRFRIIKCNEYMVNESDYLIAYVTNSFGGAAKTLDHAKRKNKIIYNLCSKK